MKTIYGGFQGVKLYLKQKVIETVYAWEDSGAEIQKMMLIIRQESKTRSIKRY